MSFSIFCIFCIFFYLNCFPRNLFCIIPNYQYFSNTKNGNYFCSRIRYSSNASNTNSRTTRPTKGSRNTNYKGTGNAKRERFTNTNNTYKSFRIYLLNKPYTIYVYLIVDLFRRKKMLDIHKIFVFLPFYTLLHCVLLINLLLLQIVEYFRHYKRISFCCIYISKKIVLIYKYIRSTIFLSLAFFIVHFINFYATKLRVK